MMENTVSFILAAYIHTEACRYSLSTVRQYYPDSDIFMYFDSFRSQKDREDYEKIAKEFNCKFIVRENQIFFVSKNDSIQINAPKMYEMCDRLTHACENTNSDWMLILEEDVILKRKIENYPQSDVGTCRSYNRPGGGSIFKRETFLNSIKNVDVNNIIRSVPDAYWAADVVLENIFRRTNTTMQEWTELAEADYRETENHAVFHGYKDLYKKEQNVE